MDQVKRPGRTSLQWTIGLGAAWLVLVIVGAIGMSRPGLPGLFLILFLTGGACFWAAVVTLIVGLVKRSQAKARPVYYVAPPQS
jgi:hypothetical protein